MKLNLFPKLSLEYSQPKPKYTHNATTYLRFSPPFSNVIEIQCPISLRCYVKMTWFFLFMFDDNNKKIKFMSPYIYPNLLPLGWSDRHLGNL